VLAHLFDAQQDVAAVPVLQIVFEGAEGAAALLSGGF
jgi:hypothetical protein